MIKLNRHNISSQEILRQVEQLCTQEEPPACTAACPLHLDVRLLCNQIAVGDFAAARKLYEKTIPFARIVARTCDAPCETTCLRQYRGGSIQIGELESHIIQQAKVGRVPPFLIPKSKKIAIVGGGLRGMTCALELAKKGYPVTIFEASNRLGGQLLEISPEKLPALILEEEIELLKKYQVSLVFNQPIDLGSPQTLLHGDDGYDAVIIACQSPWDDQRDPESLEVPGFDKLVAGRRSGRLTSGHSTIYDVFDGRSAAATIDRMMQQVSLMTGREKEGSKTTTLYTKLDDIPNESRTKLGQNPLSEDVQKEAKRCIQCECLECVKKCAFLEHYGRWPRKYVREVYNNLSIAMGQRHANDMINTCALCGQCEVVCPFGLDMKEVFRAAREQMVHTKKMPPSAFEFALLDMEYSFSEEAYALMPAPDNQPTGYVFFPGCQLPASEPSLVSQTYHELVDRLPEGLGLWLSCCGIMANWGGEEEIFEQVKSRLRRDWDAAGQPVIITACPTCQTTLTDLIGLPVRSLFDVLTPEMRSVDLTGETMRLHHACGARHQLQLKEQITQMATAMGLQLAESPLEDDQHPCCGYGGLIGYHDTSMAKRYAKRAQELLGPDDLPILTYCVNCRDRHLAEGRDSYHILELWLGDKQKMQHKPPTYSERGENRKNLKARLLAEIWHIKTEVKPQLKLYLSDEMEDKLEQRHILKRELSEAISQAEQSGRRLINPLTGNYTADYRPGNVTFWVEYLPENDGWRIVNAYSHRMSAILTDDIVGGKNHDEA